MTDCYSVYFCVLFAIEVKGDITVIQIMAGH